MDKQITAEEASILRENNPDTVFLDVREDSERATCRIERSLHIPMGDISERAHALPQDKPLIVYCHHGMRSLHVVQYLEARGFENAINLTGGIDAWATGVEPAMARY
jgi:rhodanese-related sulfurtransferase